MATAPSILVTLLNPLEERGWINRTRDPNDRRRHLVEITKAGASRFRTASEAQRQVEDEVFRALDDEQRSQLRDLLLIVRDDVIGEDDEHCATPGSLENADG
jgi:DNA-binding MarR family transcriptional regulator